MIVCKTFRFRAYPSAEQIARLAEWENTLRWLWNLAHEQRLYGLRASVKRYYTAFDQINELTALRAELPWLRDVPRDVAAQLLVELDKAWQRCFKKLAGRPRFKRHGRDIVNPCAPQSWSVIGGVLHFPKLGKVRIVEHRSIDGVGKTATLTRDIDQWYVCISSAIERELPTLRAEPVIGIDRGITLLAADSDDNRIDNPRALEKSLRRLAHAQRVACRRKKGSKNQQKAKIRVAKIHRKIRRIRDHALHEISAQYSKSHAVVVLEDLRIENMMKNPRLARNIADSSWGKLGSMLEYKLMWSGGTVAKVPAAYSSQTCSKCGRVDAASRRGIEFCCTVCGHEDHADNNAAKVLKQRYLAGESPGVITGCGGSGARGRPMRQQLRVVRPKKQKLRPSERS